MKKKYRESRELHYVQLLMLLLIILPILYFSFESNLSFKDIDNNIPRFQVYSNYVELKGSVLVDSLYVNRASSKIMDRTLYIRLKGFKLPISRIEGEYHFSLDVDKNDYDAIEFIGVDTSESIIIYPRVKEDN